MSTNEDTPVGITLAAADPDGDPLAYTVVSGPAHGTLSGTAPNLTYTPAANYNGSDSFTYKANDGKVDSNVATVSITVVPVNDPPVLSAIGNRSVNEGQLLTFTISGSDPDGTPLTYSASNLPAGASFNPTTRTFSWTPSFGQAGTYPGVRFQVSDGILEDYEDITITVTEEMIQVVIDTVDLQDLHLDGCVFLGPSGSDCASSPVTLTRANGAAMEALAGWGGLISYAAYLTSVVKDTTYWMDARTAQMIKSQAASGITKVNIVFEPIELVADTLDQNDQHLDGCIYSAQGCVGSPLSRTMANGGYTEVVAAWGGLTSYAGVYPVVKGTTYWVDAITGSKIGSEPSSPSGSTRINVVFVNHAPILAPIGDKTVFEGQPLTFTVSGSDPDGTPLTYSAANLPAGATFDAVTGRFSWTPSYIQAGTWSGVQFRVSDGLLMSAWQVIDITVANVTDPPLVVSIVAPTAPIAVNTAVNVEGTFTDPDGGDTHTAVWSWGDGTTSTGIVSPVDRSVRNNHIYTSPGVYTVQLRVQDNKGAWGESVFRYVVVYDPKGGFVTGGGWIDSPRGACKRSPCTDETIGKANFGFVAGYRPGATTPDGNTEFQFKAGDLNFKSTSYEWLVVAGWKAQFKGRGTINGAGSYRFILSAVDGQVTGGDGVDKFRIRIWADGSEGPVYDNQFNDPELGDATTKIAGGSIVIHKQ